jgi:hypothetical protein
MSASFLFEAEPTVRPDVQSLIKRLRLPLGFAARLAPEVRAPYRRIWVKPEK